MNVRKWLAVMILILCSCGITSYVWAQEIKVAEEQDTKMADAECFAADKKYDDAIKLYGELYGLKPEAVYTEYLKTLIAAQKYKEAEKLIQERILKAPSPTLHIDLGNVYKLEKKVKKAVEEFEKVLPMINGDDMLTQRIARAFVDAGQVDYAVLTYQKAGVMLGNPGIYVAQLANIYAKSGQLDNAMDQVLSGPQGQFMSVDNVKALFLEWMGQDPEKLQFAQKSLIRRINEQPANNYYAELLTWIYTQKNDWDGALIQIEAVDERNNENGKHLLDLAHTAAAAKQYETAYKAYDDVIAKGPDRPLYTIAMSEKLGLAFNRLKTAPEIKPGEITALLAGYDSLFRAYPQYYGQQVAGDYAAVAAQYADSVDKGIEILQTAIKYPDTRKNMAGTFKLQMGDYYVLEGRIWDASLLYSQVDKDFKQDVLGENARFKNARLAYYRGDFEWAQHMLKVLKASTSELIANDALYLSVEITENVEDSNFYPLSRYAYADLLLFQNKDKQAEELLDSISTAFPKHPLNDDILMLRARLAEKRHDYEKALGYLNTIVEKYGQDVLGDDALFEIAEIYRDDLHKADSAKKYYEQLIMDFPGSTFVQTARQRLRELNATTSP